MVDQPVGVGEEFSDLAVAQVVQKNMVAPERGAEVPRLDLAMATHQKPDFEAWESLFHQGGIGERLQTIRNALVGPRS